MDGILVINKGTGFTSFDVVAKLRGMLKIRKIGHTGTLDPDATGVLPVCIGKATGLCDMLTDTNKEYEAVLLFGMETDTQDITGTVLTQKEVKLKEDEAVRIILSFIGSYQQIPPMYSALKVGGKKLCDLARAGVTIERQPREVRIFDIEIKQISLPEVLIKVSCSKGTYIRTLCHDIGQVAGCGACMKSLIRTKAAGFYLENAYTLSQVEQMLMKNNLKDAIVPIDSIFKEYRKLIVKPEYQKLTDNGNSIRTIQCMADVTAKKGEKFCVYSQNGLFYGVYEENEGMLKPKKMFFAEP